MSENVNDALEKCVDKVKGYALLSVLLVSSMANEGIPAYADEAAYVIHDGLLATASDIDRLLNNESQNPIGSETA